MHDVSILAIMNDPDVRATARARAFGVDQDDLSMLKYAIDIAFDRLGLGTVIGGESTWTTIAAGYFAEIRDVKSVSSKYVVDHGAFVSTYRETFGHDPSASERANFASKLAKATEVLRAKAAAKVTGRLEAADAAVEQVTNKIEEATMEPKKKDHCPEDVYDTGPPSDKSHTIKMTPPTKVEQIVAAAKQAANAAGESVKTELTDGAWLTLGKQAAKHSVRIGMRVVKQWIPAPAAAWVEVQLTTSPPALALYALGLGTLMSAIPRFTTGKPMRAKLASSMRTYGYHVLTDAVADPLLDGLGEAFDEVLAEHGIATVPAQMGMAGRVDDVLASGMGVACVESTL